MVKRIILFLFPVPPAQRFDRAMTNVDRRIALIERRLQLRVPPPPTSPAHVRVIWRAPETEAV